MQTTPELDPSFISAKKDKKGGAKSKRRQNRFKTSKTLRMDIMPGGPDNPTKDGLK